MLQSEPTEKKVRASVDISHRGDLTWQLVVCSERALKINRKWSWRWAAAGSLENDGKDGVLAKCRELHGSQVVMMKQGCTRPVHLSWWKVVSRGNKATLRALLTAEDQCSHLPPPSLCSASSSLLYPPCPETRWEHGKFNLIKQTEKEIW